jgi:excisionase family DNA binding protein
MREIPADQQNASSLDFEPLLDAQQAADLMRVHPESVKRRARRGEIPGMKFGKLWRFRATALESYVREMMRESRTHEGENMAPSQPAVRAMRNRRN